jgi:DNA polymerase I/DNA polymerase-2
MKPDRLTPKGVVRFCLLDIDYEVADKPIVKLIGVDENGRSVLVLDDTFKPYFYMMPEKKAETLLKKSKMITVIEKTKKRLGIKDVDVLKVFVDIPQNVPAVRDLVKKHTDCYEYAINFYRRYMIDRGFYPLDWIEVSGKEEKDEGFDVHILAETLERMNRMTPKASTGTGKTPNFKIMAFDLEVVDKKIVMASMAGKNMTKAITYKKTGKAHVVKGEKELIEELVKTITDYDPDILVGYNSDQFDFEVLRSRADEYKIPLTLGRDGKTMKFARRTRSSSAKLFGRVHIDLFAYVNNLMSQQLQSEVFTLNEVSKELIGEGKKELSLEDIISLWDEDVSKLAEYCVHDSALTLKLAEHILVQIFELSKVCGQLPFDVSRATFGALSEWFLVRKAHEKNIIVPNNPHWDEIQQRRMYSFQGGYVKEPIQGLHENIAVFDFRSLYPSIIATFNISPETLSSNKAKNVYKVPEYKHAFLKAPRGFVSEIVEELIKRRQEVKKKIISAEGEEKKELAEHQFALKILANATYGMFGNPSARWYCRECAESSAAFGRFYIKKSIADAEKFGFTALYSDTDSLFVKASGPINKQAKEFLEKMNKALPGMLELELQGLYTRGLFVPQKIGNYTAKKRYALIDAKGALTIRGLETVRRDWCDAARSLQREVIKLTLTNKEKEAVGKVKETVRNVRNRKISLHDITITTMLGKPLEEYKAVGPHVAVAKKLQQQGHDIRQGEFISYIITKPTAKNQSISNRAEPINTVKLEDYDIDYYLRNQIVSVALRVLSVFGYTEDDFLADELKKFVKK